MHGLSADGRAAGAQTVLVVDDHGGFRAGTRRLLEQHRYRVVEAVDGAGALRAAMSEQPDLILLDVRLPDMDGFAVADALRRAGSAAAVLLISTLPRADLAERLDAAAADGSVDGFIDKADLSASTIASGLAARR